MRAKARRSSLPLSFQRRTLPPTFRLHTTVPARRTAALHFLRRALARRAAVRRRRAAVRRRPLSTSRAPSLSSTLWMQCTHPLKPTLLLHALVASRPHSGLRSTARSRRFMFAHPGASILLASMLTTTGTGASQVETRPPRRRKARLLPLSHHPLTALNSLIFPTTAFPLQRPPHGALVAGCHHCGVRCRRR